MKVRFKILFQLFLCVGIFFPTHSFSYSTETKDQSLDQIIKGLSAEEKIGQLLMIGLQEQSFSKREQSHVLKIRPGFIILFKKNISTPSQTLKLIQKTEGVFKNANYVPPVFTVDQEGGDVVRIPTTPPLPTAIAVGELGEPELAKKLGDNVGKILSSLHIYMNLAPVLDLTEYSPTSFIQTRSYGPDPQIVHIMARSFIDGLSKHKVLSTAKHFPGIGLTSNDSHKSISFADLTEDELVQSLDPYKKLIKESKLDAIMMTHHIYKNIDSLPATYSKKIISMLRKKLGFEGLIVTDDVEMVGAKIHKTPESRAVEAFLAGNDVIMVAWNKSSQKRAFNGLLKAYSDGIISEDRLNYSLKRILTAKKETPLFNNDKSSVEEVLLTLKDEDLKNTVDLILKKKVAKEFSKNQIDLSKKFYVVSSDIAFLNSFKMREKARTQYITSSTKASDIRLRKQESLVFHVSGPKSSALLSQITKKSAFKDRILVINSRFKGLAESSVPTLHIQMKHPLLGGEIASYISEFKNRGLSSENVSNTRN